MGDTRVEITKIQPYGDLVLVEFDNDVNKTASGIITKVQKSTLDRPTRGKVIAVGPEVKDIKIGDVVVFESIRGQDIDENHMMLGYKTILGILNESN